MVATLIAVSFSLVASGDVFELEMPQSPTWLSQTRSHLHHHWNGCQQAQYPNEPLKGVYKATAQVRRQGRRVQVRLRLLDRDGRPLRLDRSQRRFVRCVKRGMARVRVVRPRTVRYPGWVATGGAGRAVFSKGDGTLTVGPARRYLLDRATAARRACGVGQGFVQGTVIAKVHPTKGVAEVIVELRVGGYAPPTYRPARALPAGERCVAKRLQRRLTFPRVTVEHDVTVTF